MNTTPTLTEPRTETTSIPGFLAHEPRIEVTAELGPRYEEILTPDALDFLAALHDRFAGIRHDRLAARLRNPVDIGSGRNPRFLDETAHIRQDTSWRVAGPGPGLEDRRVEITGPTDRKMAINALNSGARVWLADQEDATSPTWQNVIEGQLTLLDALHTELSYTSPEGKHYSVTHDIAGPDTPTIVMRPRGWHLPEEHLRFHDRTGRRMSASGSLVDFGLYFFHNATRLIELGSGPYFYLPKLEGHLEARLWNDVFVFAQEYPVTAQVPGEETGKSHGNGNAGINHPRMPREMTGVGIEATHQQPMCAGNAVDAIHEIRDVDVRGDGKSPHGNEPQLLRARVDHGHNRRGQATHRHLQTRTNLHRHTSMGELKLQVTGNGRGGNRNVEQNGNVR